MTVKTGEMSHTDLGKLARAVIHTVDEDRLNNLIKDKDLFDLKTWASDIQFTLKWINAGRVEHGYVAKARRLSRNQTTARHKEKTFTYQLENTITPEPPSTPDWRAVCHNRVMDIEGTYSVLNSSDQQQRGARSLRYYTAKALAPYPENIKPAMLSSCAWKEGWMHVWTGCQKRGEDSYNVFKMFADEFAHEPDFSCHEDQIYGGLFLSKFEITQFNDLSVYASKARLETYGGVRRFYLQNRLIKTCKRHRFEFLPHDTNIFSLSKSLSSQKFDFITLLDLSGKHFNRSCYLQIITLPHLIGLDVTACQIDRNILFCWMLAIRNGLWKSLRLLCIGQNDISGVISLLVMCPTLTYIESDQNIDVITETRGQWERRHKLYDTVARAYGRGNVNKPNAPRFSRSLFPRHFGIGQKYAMLKQLYADFKKYPPLSSGNNVPLIVNPEFSVKQVQNEKHIIQEFEIGKPPQKQTLVQKNFDPIMDLWVDESSGANYQMNSSYIQEFFRRRHSSRVLDLERRPSP
ncbi:uncharacterized protein SAPINGB_P005526 [Magnusiomyces paraingens]|uniref:Uncharacterized protein n=1 Tax=Magnusiomyces paraingens TaxID=2606893 RepID=A0A5E8C059_9ASCO|nr:uncharacterized protein SAPINGB_P005526 [Saprochaete ingens]VVT57084.1 unnamed protein product [Saprochaete ingens]